MPAVSSFQIFFQFCVEHLQIVDYSRAYKTLSLVRMCFGTDSMFKLKRMAMWKVSFPSSPDMPCFGLEEAMLFCFLLWALGCLGVLAINAAAVQKFSCILRFLVTISQNDRFFCFLTKDRTTVCDFACHTNLA